MNKKDKLITRNNLLNMYSTKYDSHEFRAFISVSGIEKDFSMLLLRMTVKIITR